MLTQATYKTARISAQKARLVIDQIRNKKSVDAMNILSFMNKKAAFLIKKTLSSALANAKNQHNSNIEELYISSAYVNEGITMKRIMIRARSRRDQIKKRTSHLTIQLSKIKTGKI
jgi:large subunit ribosomal protein L22